MFRQSRLILFVAVILWAYTSAQLCFLPHESDDMCGKLCFQTCRNPVVNPRLCSRIPCVWQFTSGCRCDNGYLRDTDSGYCVLPEDCPPQS